MKKYRTVPVLLCLLFAFCTHAISQDKYTVVSRDDGIVTSVDEFTGDVKTETGYVKINNELESYGHGRSPLINMALALLEYKNRDVLIVGLKFYMYHPEKELISINRGQKMLIKMENGEVISLKSFSDVVPQQSEVLWVNPDFENQRTESRWIEAVYSITYGGVKSLATNKIEKFRVYTSDGFRVFAPGGEESNAEDFRSVAAQFIQHIGVDTLEKAVSDW